MIKLFDQDHENTICGHLVEPKIASMCVCRNAPGHKARPVVLLDSLVYLLHFHEISYRLDTVTKGYQITVQLYR